MAPSTKKRKDPLPDRTLMDFFSGADAIKRARMKTSHLQQLTHSVRQTKVASREIIVIDSDGDDGVHGKEDGKASARLDSSSKDKDTFGVPSELLRPITSRMEPSSNAHQHSPIATKPDQSESMFGISAPLLGQTCVSSCFWAFLGVEDGLNLACTGSQLTERSQSKLFANEYISTMAEGNSADDSAIGFPIGEWTFADDELVALEFSDNSVEIDEDEGEPFNDQHFCPVCGMDLTGIIVLVSTPNWGSSNQPADFCYSLLRKHRLMSINVLTTLHRTTTPLSLNVHQSRCQPHLT